jgi:hypothetical protein
MAWRIGNHGFANKAGLVPGSTKPGNESGWRSSHSRVGGCALAKRCAGPQKVMGASVSASPHFPELSPLRPKAVRSSLGGEGPGSVLRLPARPFSGRPAEALLPRSDPRRVAGRYCYPASFSFAAPLARLRVPPDSSGKWERLSAFASASRFFHRLARAFRSGGFRSFRTSAACRFRQCPGASSASGRSAPGHKWRVSPPAESRNGNQPVDN